MVMEKQLRPSPAKFSALLILLAFSVISTTAGDGGGISERELENVMAALRSNGYDLLGNAISTSDLRYQMTAGESFTLFSPRDSNLFSLDMSSDGSVYVQTLRYHVAPLRLTISDLRNLSSRSIGIGSYLETLLPHSTLLIGKPHAPLDESVSDDVVTVNGVRISYPDLYIGSRIAVHGLDGILEARFKYSDIFSGELGLESQPVWQEQYLVPPHSPHSAPNLITPARLSPEISGSNSMFKKRGKRDRPGIHDDRQDDQDDDDEDNDSQIQHDKFSKFSRGHFTGDI